MIHHCEGQQFCPYGVFSRNGLPRKTAKVMREEGSQGRGGQAATSIQSAIADFPNTGKSPDAGMKFSTKVYRKFSLFFFPVYFTSLYTLV